MELLLRRHSIDKEMIEIFSGKTLWGVVHQDCFLESPIYDDLERFDSVAVRLELIEDE